MTMHKAKGLEANRVFIIRPDLLPHRLSERPWQRDQEENLLYVSITRAREELHICKGDVPLDLSGASAGGKSSGGSVGGGVWGTRFFRLRGDTPLQDRRAAAAPAAGAALSRPVRRRPNGGLAVGVRVRSSRYGEGIVVGLVNRTGQTTVEIDFPSAGRKKFVIPPAELEVLS
jgi:hypothetical protein